MLGRNGRTGIARVFHPIAQGAQRLGITPDAITWTGTVLGCAAALALLIPGRFAIGAVVLTIVLLFDSLDGLLARLTGRSSRWGAFLDSTLDRLADSVVLGALALHCLAVAPRTELSIACGVLALASLIAQVLISYAKARADSLGLSANVGLLERADRFVVLLPGVFLTQWLGLWALLVTLAVLSLGSAWTVGQRMVAARRSERAFEAPAAPGEQPVPEQAAP